MKREHCEWRKLEKIFCKPLKGGGLVVKLPQNKRGEVGSKGGVLESVERMRELMLAMASSMWSAVGRWRQ